MFAVILDIICHALCHQTDFFVDSPSLNRVKLLSFTVAGIDEVSFKEQFKMFIFLLHALLTLLCGDV